MLISLMLVLLTNRKLLGFESLMMLRYTIIILLTMGLIVSVKFC